MAKGANIVLCEYSSSFSILSNCNSESFGWYCTVNKNTNVCRSKCSLHRRWWCLLVAKSMTAVLMVMGGG
eukprot:scaffold10488_cov117-Alexandrium_tamarense.AAC.1